METRAALFERLIEILNRSREKQQTAPRGKRKRRAGRGIAPLAWAVQRPPAAVKKIAR